MKVQPINTAQPQFKARLPKSQINQILAEYSEESVYHGISKQDIIEIIPKLYTLLEMLDSRFPGKKAEITSEKYVSQYRAMGGYPSGTINTLNIDGQKVKEDNCNKFWLLYQFLTEHKTPDERILSMPQSLFDQMWWANRNKTREDLSKFALVE